MRLLIRALRDAADAQIPVNLSLNGNTFRIDNGEYFYASANIDRVDWKELEIEMARFVWKLVARSEINVNS